MYREHAPPPALAPFVECIWTREDRLPVGVERATRVLPDGCMDILFNLGDPPLPRSWPHHRLSAWVVGAMPTAEVVHQGGEIAMVGVRLRPGGAPAFLRFPAREARGSVVPLDALWGAAAAELAERLAATPGAEARARRVAQALEARLAPGAAPDPLVAAADRRLRASGGGVPVARLARSLGTTPRSLERRFAAAVGLTPKESARVVRFRRALRLVEEGSIPLAAAALSAGYVDQAHLTREFRVLTGVTPGAWRSGRAVGG